MMMMVMIRYRIRLKMLYPAWVNFQIWGRAVYPCRNVSSSAVPKIIPANNYWC